jgi:hypothetical protein
MNVMEEALVDIKKTSATLISNQQLDKTEVVKLFIIPYHLIFLFVSLFQLFQNVVRF